MIQIWQDGVIISVQANMENAQYFVEKNRLKNVELVKVIDG